MNTTCPLVIALALAFGLAATLHAGPRTSTSYSITADTFDAAGGRTTSVNYTHDGNLSDVAGISTGGAPALTLKQGYIGQLYDATGVALTSVTGSASLNELGTLQLAGWQAHDDATLLPLPAAGFTWSVQSGPLVSISAGGLVTAASVPQNTTATAQAVFGGSTGTLNLTVLDTISDNFGSYAGDGLPDDWQVQYFGEDNAAAAPLRDPDHDGINNLFENVAGLVPTDPLSVLRWRIAAVPGQPAQKQLIFSPRLTDRTYTVETSAIIGTAATWQELTGGTVSDNNDERTITDPNATTGPKFYRLQIARP